MPCPPSAKLQYQILHLADEIGKKATSCTEYYRDTILPLFHNYVTVQVPELMETLGSEFNLQEYYDYQELNYRLTARPEVKDYSKMIIEFADHLKDDREGSYADKCSYPFPKLSLWDNYIPMTDTVMSLEKAIRHKIPLRMALAAMMQSYDREVIENGIIIDLRRLGTLTTSNRSYSSYS